MEKTPSNCFRVAFVHAVLPDVRFLHIVRDGRDVARSAAKRWTETPVDPSAIWRRLTSFEMPIRDLPYYAVDKLRVVLGRKTAGGRTFVWGPKFRGIREVKTREGVEATCAIQWRESVRATREGLAAVPSHQQLTVRFEDLVNDPTPNLVRILDFLGLSRSDEVLDYASEVIESTAASRWKNEGPGTVFEPHLQPLLSELGYV